MKGIITNKISKRYSFSSSQDPTQTLTIRRLFVSQFKQRYRDLINKSNTSIILNDCFGLKRESNQTHISAAIDKPNISHLWKGRTYELPYKRFAFNTNEEKITGFMEWLTDMEKLSLFELSYREDIRSAINPIWTNIFISYAYKRGMQWARMNIRRDPTLMTALRIKPYEVNYDSETINSEFTDFQNADRAAILYTRSYNDLRGINAVMDTQISRILAESILVGIGPREIAKQISDRIEKIGLHRAIILARTETIRAHHLAAIQTYRDFGVKGVMVKAEWKTAGDSRVCELCSPNEGRIFTLDQAEGMIPVHPQCRCAVLPVVIN